MKFSILLEINLFVKSSIEQTKMIFIVKIYHTNPIQFFPSVYRLKDFSFILFSTEKII